MGRTKRKRRRNSHSKAICLNNNMTIINLFKQLKNGYNWTNSTYLHLYDFPQTGRGVSSTKTLKTNSTLIEIPFVAMISLASIEIIEFYPIFSNSVKPMSTQTILAAYLLLEFHKKAKSRWKFYIDSLPVENPLSHMKLSQKDLQFLPETLNNQIEYYRDRFENAFSSLEQNVGTKKCPCCHDTFMHCVFSKDLFAWSYAVINTRAVYVDPAFVKRHAAEKFHQDVFLDCISLEEQPNMALCPLLDMFNHSFHVETRAEVVREISGQHFYRLSTLTDFRKHEQIFISYGNHDSIKLFVEYGFFIAGNCYDALAFDFKSLIESLHIKLEARHYKLCQKFCDKLFVTIHGELSFNLKAVLFICLVGNFKEVSSKIYNESYTEAEHYIFAKCIVKIIKFGKSELRISDNATQDFIDYLNYELPKTISVHLRKQYNLQ